MALMMKTYAAAFLALLLAIPAGGQVQLCKHESGPFHIQTEPDCDGMRKHSDHHDHHHEDDHSQHHSAGEHHEPCSHDIVSTDNEYASVNSDVSGALLTWVAALPSEDFCSLDRFENKEAKYLSSLTRGPPVKNCPLGYFALSIRLLI